MGEQTRHHEILAPLKEIAQALGQRVLNLIVPPEALDIGIQNESARRTSTQLSFEEHFGYDVVAPQPPRNAGDWDSLRE